MKRTLLAFYKKNILLLDAGGFRFILAMKCMLAGAFSLLLVYCFSFKQGLFLFLPTVLFMLIAPAESMKNTFLSVLYTGIFAGIGCFLATVSGYSTFYSVVVLFSFAFLAVYFNRFRFFTGGIWALAIIVLAAGTSDDVSAAAIRVGNIALSLIIVIILTFFVNPYFSTKNYQRRLSITLEKMAAYFYQSIADSLRGNHLTQSHHQQKNEIIKSLLINRCFCQGLRATEQLIYLKEIAMCEENVFENISALANIFNKPLYHSVITAYFPDLEKFYRVTYQLYRQISRRIKTGNRNQNFQIKYFDTVIAELTEYIQQSIQAIMHRETVYYWPFDLSNFIYLLNVFQRTTHSLINTVTLK